MTSVCGACVTAGLRSSLLFGVSTTRSEWSLSPDTSKQPTLLEIYSQDTIVNRFTFVGPQVRGQVFLFSSSNLLLCSVPRCSINLSSRFFSWYVSKEKCPEGCFHSSLHQITCFSHHVEWPHPGGPMILHCMIGSCPWVLRCVSQEDQWMLWSCEPPHW